MTLNPPSSADANVPILLLDVDGTTAPLGRVSRTRDGHRHVRDWHTVGKGWSLVSVMYSPTIIGRIRGWHEAGVVEPRWLTTWGQDANRTLSPAWGFGELHTYSRSDALPPEPVDCDFCVHCEHYSDGEDLWWKERVVTRVLGEQQRRVVWAEDQIGDKIGPGPCGPGRLDEMHREFPGRLLTICPDPRAGLTVADLDLIERWATERTRSPFV